MKIRIFLRIISMLSLGMYLLVFSLSMPLEAAVPDKNQITLSSLQNNDISTHSEVRNTLLSLNKWIAAKDKKEIKTTIEELKTLRLRWRNSNIPFLADFLRIRGEFLLQSGEHDLGIFLLEEAKDAFPDDYGIHLALGKFYWSPQGFEFNRGYVNLKEGLGLYLNSELRRNRFVYSSIIFISFLLALAIYLYFMVLLLKNYRKINYDFKKILKLDLNSSFSSFLAMLLILLPGITGGFYLFILTIPAFLWPYLKNSKRAVLAILTAFLLFFPTLTGNAHEERLKYNSAYNNKLEDFSHKIWDTETLHYFKDRLDRDKLDFYSQTAVGLLFKWMGDQKKYHTIFSKLTQENPNYLPGLINLGNSQLLAGKPDEALKIYQKALKINPDSVEAHYNSSLALEENLKLEEAKAEYQKASDLDTNRVKRLENRLLTQKTPYKVQPLDNIPDTPEFQVKENYQIPSTRIKESFLNFLLISSLKKESVLPLTSALFFLIILLIWRSKKLTKASQQCRTCGTVYDLEKKCPTCLTMMTSLARLDVKTREMVFENRWRYNRLKKTVAILFNVLLPGAGLIFDDAELSGFILMFLTLFLVIGVTLLFLCPWQPFPLNALLTFLPVYYLLLNLFLFFQVRYGS